MAMRLCETCGKVLRPTDIFCVNCGTKAPLESAPKPTPNQAEQKPVVAFCPECGSRVRPKWLFCMQCGQKLTKPQGKPEVAVSQPPVSSYRPPTSETYQPAMGAVPSSPGVAFSSDVPSEPSTADRSAYSSSVSSSLFSSTFDAEEQSSMSSMQPFPTSTHTIRIDDLSFMSGGAVTGTSQTSFDYDRDAFDDWDKTDAGYSADDAPTTVYDEDDDALTMVYEEVKARPICKFTRTSTGDVISCDTLPMTLGRGSMADVRITGNPYVGRKHVRVTERDGEFYVEDLGSANHTYVNGVQIASGELTPIHDGDVIALGKEELTVTIE